MRLKTIRQLRRTAAVLLSAVFLFCDPAGRLVGSTEGITEVHAAATADEKAKIDAAKKKKESLEAERKKTRDKIDKLKSLKQDTATYIKELDGELSEIVEEISRLTDEIGKKSEEVDAAKAELVQAEETADQQFQDMKKRIKYMYENGHTGFVELLLSSDNLTDLFNHAEYVSKISQYDRSQLDVYQAACDEIEAKKIAYEGELSQLEDLKDQETVKQASVEELMKEKQSELSSYTAGISTAEGELSDYEKEIAAQESEIQAVEAAIKKREEEERKRREEEERRRREEEARKKREAEAAAAAAASGGSKSSGGSSVSLGSLRLRWPCPASGRITSGFGSRKSPTKGASTTHNGIDIGAPSGSAIVAAADGEVVTATYSGSAGNYIMLSHGGGVYTLYMHCSKLLVGVGQHVKAGQTIAKVGSTGVSTGPHLHFGVRAGGQYVNPSKYVSP